MMNITATYNHKTLVESVQIEKTFEKMLDPKKKWVWKNCVYKKICGSKVCIC